MGDQYAHTIEKIAEAIWNEWSLWASPIRQPKPQWHELAFGHKDTLRRMACRAIEALDTAATPQANALASLRAAIDYAFEVQGRGLDGLVWLDEWRHGDPKAMAELEAWRAAA